MLYRRPQAELYRLAPNSREFLQMIGTQSQREEIITKAARVKIPENPTFERDHLFSAEREAVKGLRELGVDAVPGFQMFGISPGVKGSWDLATNMFYKVSLKGKSYEQMVWVETHGLEDEMRVKTDQQMYRYFLKLMELKMEHPENRLIYVTNVPRKIVENEYPSIKIEYFTHRWIYAPLNTEEGKERFREVMRNFINLPQVAIEKDRRAWLEEVKNRMRKEVGRAFAENLRKQSQEVAKE